MALQRPHLVKLLAMAGAFLATLGTLVLLHRGESSTKAGPSAAQADLPRPGASTDELIRGYQASVRAAGTGPASADLYAALGGAYLQKVRENGDPGLYVRADAALRAGQRLAPRNYRVLGALGTLALARHEFSRGLQLGRAARTANPDANLAFPVIVDALVELGRYRAAGAELQRFSDRKPALASYARVSYFRELHGDLAGALQAIRLAVSAGGDSAENAAYAQTLLGNVEFDLGHLAAARSAYRLALARFPRYLPAGAGVARVEAATGRTAAAIAGYRDIVTRLPLPEYVIALGETELAGGRPVDGRRDLALVRAEEQLLQANGVNTDAELALYEANHGDAHQGVALGRRAWASAPSVRSADALGWALTAAGRPHDGLTWARRALRLGSRDASFLYHAGISARGAGQRSAARRYLTASLAYNRRFSPLYAPRARQALKDLR